MENFWRSKSRLLAAFIVCSFYLLNLSFCWSLNDEGVALLRFKEKIVGDPHGALSNWTDEIGVESPCSWFGVECTDGYVVVLNLRDLCLRGTLAPDIGNLVHMKCIILRNNSFSGFIPEEVTNLKELELLDLGYNNFSGQLPCHLDNNFKIAFLLLDNNELLGRTKSSNDQEISWNSGEQSLAGRKLLQAVPSGRRMPVFRFPPLEPPIQHKLPPAPALAPAPAPAPAPSPPPPPPLSSPSPSRPPSSRQLTPPSSPSPANRTTISLHTPRERLRANSGTNRKLILGAAIGGPVLLLLLIIGILFYRCGKVATVKPWATGLSGQLQRAFVTGVPKLKRSELEAACEDFSNVIGSSSFCTLYKGTLSSGVEIAVASIAVVSAKDWSSNLEAQFRKKIDTLSKVNHKNFISLLGFCEEEEPFTRMLVFEYAPNGTLFEHVHIREAEHLDWTMRLRIAMGMAYCLEHMHQSTPPLPHRNLTSSTIYLTEDYAAKVSDFVFWDETGVSERQPTLQSNVYSFGVVLFEMITGKLPYAAGSDFVEDWASDYLRGTQPLREMVDPTLRTYQEDQLQQIGDVVKWCVDPDPRQRPTMREVSGRLREVTGVSPDGAVPKVSPLWWAELEILSTEAS